MLLSLFPFRFPRHSIGLPLPTDASIVRLRELPKPKRGTDELMEKMGLESSLAAPPRSKLCPSSTWRRRATYSVPRGELPSPHHSSPGLLSPPLGARQRWRDNYPRGLQLSMHPAERHFHGRQPFPYPAAFFVSIPVSLTPISPPLGRGQYCSCLRRAAVGSRKTGFFIRRRSPEVKYCRLFARPSPLSGPQMQHWVFPSSSPLHTAAAAGK